MRSLANAGRRAASWLRLALALGLVGAVPAEVRPPADVCRTLPPLPVRFEFGAGAAPVGAAFARDGGVVVGTAEGYVHALRADGSYRWSYTLTGPVIGSPAVSDAGVVFVATARSVYALRADGGLLWLFRSPVRIQAGLARDAQGRLHFASADGRLFALSGRGALVAHVPGKHPLSAGPVVLGGDAVAAGARTGGVVLSAGGRVSRFRLSSPVRAVLGCPGARLCAIAGGSLHALGGADWHVPALWAAANGDFLAVLGGERELSLYRGAGRELAYRVALPEPAREAPAVDAAGNAYVPLRSGALLAVGADGAPRGCWSFAFATLDAPLLDAPRRRILVTAREGLVASVGVE